MNSCKNGHNWDKSDKEKAVCTDCGEVKYYDHERNYKERLKFKGNKTAKKTIIRITSAVSVNPDHVIYVEGGNNVGVHMKDRVIWTQTSDFDGIVKAINNRIDYYNG